MKKKLLRISCLILAVLLLVSDFAPLASAAGFVPEELCTINQGQVATIKNHNLSVVQSTNLTFWAEGEYGFIAKISTYDIFGELLEQETVFVQKKDSWLELYFYGKTIVIEVLLGTMTVTYNMHTPKCEVTSDGEIMTWTAKTSFENIYLTVGDTAEYGFYDVYPGFSIWLEDDYFYKNEKGEKTAFESSNYRIASVDPNGIITANSPGEATITVAYRLGLTDENSILYVQKCKVTVLEDYGIGSAYDNYYASGTEKYFNISGVGASQPLTEIEVEHWKQQYNTGDEHELMMDVYPESGKSVIFSKPGYHTYEMKPQYVSDYNFITLCLDDGSSAPIVKAVMGCDLSNNVWQNLRVQALSVKAGGNYCVDVDIDWQDHEPLAVWLQQGNTKVTFGTYESSGFIHLGSKLSIDGGPVYLYAQAVDGTIVKTQVLLNIYAPVEVFELDFGDETGLRAEPENVDGFDDIGFEIKLEGSLPIEYSVDADGKVKGTVGIKLVEGELSNQTYNTIKDGLSKKPGSPGEGVDVSEMIDKLMSDNSIEPQWIKKSFTITCDMMVLGCFEGYVKNGKTYFTDFNLAVCLKGEAKYSQQSMAFYVPYYWTVSLETKIESQLVAIREDTSGSLKFRFPETTLTVEAAGALSLGIQGLAGVGAELAGALEIKFKTGEMLNQGVWTLRVTFMPLVEAFGFELKFELWEPYKKVIYDGSKNSIYQDQNYIMAGRSYYVNTTFVGETVVSQGQSITTETVFTDLYHNSNPQIATNGEKTLMLWIDDNEARSDENRTCLYYCVYDEIAGALSEPVTVMDDGKPDFTPKLYCIDGKTHLVWLKASCEFQTGTTLSETAAMMDVYYAEFDFENGIFTDPVNLSTSEGVYDFSPYVTTVNQQITVVWGSNHSGDMFSAEKCYSISAAQLTETGWQTQTLMTGLVPINGLTACEKDGALCVCFCGHTDGQLGTLDDLELFTLSQGALTQMTENNQPDVAPEYFRGTLYFCNGSKLTDGETGFTFPSQKTNYTMITNVDQTVTAVLYTVFSEDAHNIYATVNNGNGWGEPVCVTDLHGQYITDFSACFVAGELITVASLREIVDGTLGSASLVKSSKSVFADLAITDAYYEPLSLTDNGVLRGSVTLINRGMQTVDAALISVYDVNDTCLATVQVKDVPILPGETKTVPFICKVDDINSDSLQVVVSTPVTEEPNTANNAFALQISKHDISVENAYITAQDDGFSTVTVFLANRGMEDIYGVRLTFHKDAPDGEELGVLLTASLLVGEKKMYSLRIPTDAVEHVVYVAAQIEQTENTYANNTNYAYAGSIKTTVEADEKYCTGDVNGDGIISEEDVLSLRRYLVGGYGITVNLSLCDLNNDGAVNAKDVAALRRLLAEADE